MNSNATSASALPRADFEFKLAVGLLAFLSIVSTVLLQVLAHISPFSRDYVSGFLPFLFLLLPYILFSSAYFNDAFRAWTSGAPAKKMIFPAYLLGAYLISSRFSGNFQWALLGKLALWLFFPTILFLRDHSPADPISWREVAATLSLWLPIELGKLPGFDIVFNKDIQLPALAFAAPALGLYLFPVLRNLPGVGYTFTLKGKDLLAAALGILLLALLLIPMGTGLGFIRMSRIDTSFAKSVELILGIYFLVAIPEELLFRGIIQNLMARTLGGRHARLWALLGAAAIFGLSHWNNYNPPDWRYVFLATIAGLVYGTVYFKTGKTTASALVHCGVNFCWALLFKDTSG